MPKSGTNFGCGQSFDDDVVIGGGILRGMLSGVYHLDFKGACTHINLKYIPHLYFVRGAGRPAVDHNPAGVTGGVSHGAALDNARNL